MNRTAKTILIIVAALVPVGIMAILIGVMFGGKMGWNFQMGGPKFGVSTGVISGAKDLKDFDSLKVDVSSTDVYVTTGDSYRIEYKVNEGMEPVITEKDNKLEVTKPSNIAKVSFGFGAISSVYIITVPNNSKEITLDLEASSGDISVDGLKAAGKIEASSGDIYLNNLDSKELKVKASSGNIEILNSSCKEAECKTSSGEIDIKDSKVDELECEASSGDVTIDLDGDEDEYSYDLDSSSGSIRLNDQKFDEDYKKDGKGDKKIKVNTTSGDIEISF